MSKDKDYPRPSVTVDLVILTIAENDLKVLLIRRGQDPFAGRWALPGGFVEM
ncbi:MAG: NUDIX hydrolase, partial [Acidobacteria bacterium]|nr:NUDIX hydrolase [Acidobacteriota bacterium]